MRCLRPEGTSCISDILGRGSGVLKTGHLLHRRAGSILRRGRFCFSRLIFYIIHLFHGLIKFLMFDSCIILEVPVVPHKAVAEVSKIGNL